MKGPRAYVVDKLVKAAVEGIENAEDAADATAAETVSACFTLTMRIVKAVRENGSADDLKACRSALEVLLLECADSGHPN